MRDFYEVLGVGREASDGEIKKAYRKLAMEYHPDRNPGDKSAEDRFKEAASAYKVLSDPNQRARYDQFGHEGLNGASAGFRGVDDVFSAFGDLFADFFGQARGRRERRGADLEVGVELTFAEAVHGATKEIEVHRQEPCDVCNGSGAKAGTSRETCGTCKGKGQVLHAQGFFMIQTTCPSCRGEGSTVRERCGSCRGSGTIGQSSTLTVSIPAGVDDGQTLRLAGKGEAARGQAGGAAGHLYVQLRVLPDERFLRDGEDVLTEVPMSYVMAALGGEVEVPTLDGKMTLRVPEGTQSGKTFRLPGKGLPQLGGRARGDQIVQIFVEVPSKLTGRQRELLEQFGRETGTDVSPVTKSFVGKLKDLLG